MLKFKNLRPLQYLYTICGVNIKAVMISKIDHVYADDDIIFHLAHNSPPVLYLTKDKMEESKFNNFYCNKEDAVKFVLDYCNKQLM